MRYANIPEEELKNKVAQDHFSDYDCTKIIGKVDFCASPHPPKGELFKEQSLLWAEVKAGKRDVIDMFAQLILTIGRARTFNQHLPPAFLGAFDAEKIAFVPYEKASDLFYKNDFNWNVAPSDHATKEFTEIKALITDVLAREKHLYYFGKDDDFLKFFIKKNLAKGTEKGKIQIDKDNFVSIFHRWQKEVKPIIDLDFGKDKKHRFLDANFYLADLFVDDQNTTAMDDGISVRDDLFVIFKDGGYRITKDDLKTLFDAIISIKNRSAHENFWKRYKRPPIKAFQDYILDRKDLLVPQDFRERKGAFFTPQKWVELSQKYIADVLGANWQNEYYVWDCCSGTGNLLVGLTNSRHIYASTLDQSDVNEMKELNKNTEKLLENHVFQFDFLNDGFFDVMDKKTKEAITPSKLPKSLQNILKDPEKRKKLLIYINPPYVEGDSAIGRGRKGVHQSSVHEKYQSLMKRASGELFAQFLIRIYKEIPACIIANFSTFKILQGPNFSDFRKEFQAKLSKLFLVPAATFDNVNGSFPIGFFVWDTEEKELFKRVYAHVYDKNSNRLKNKKIINYDGSRYISDWLAEHSKNKETEPIGNLASVGNDFQNQRMVFIENVEAKRKIGGRHTLIYSETLVIVSIYFAVRHCIKQTWLNNQDQFLYPINSWKKDIGFHNDCLLFTLFNVNIKSEFGTNHWIPFTEKEVGAKEAFESRFMSDFIAGKIKKSNGNGDLFNKPNVENGVKCKFSPEAQAVFDAGKELYRYYHSHKDVNVNASLYDVREYFQGRNEKTKRMNSTSSDEKYSGLKAILNKKLTILADKIAEKVHEHEFLRG